ncbi:hypothetical protein EV44_g3829 [Erysiphe necator]|uniref:Uncharacterized protein n=1 Tax=Uncinula necator TaxID=52586 RepID=A0A0B1PD60_UNCNE|nr:hypothetical protein EV44_g3829 [Erysiphe necator]
MTDSIYGSLEKANWKVMLERRLSTRLRNALVTAHNVPSEYYSFVAYLRQKDAAYQEINYRATTSERPVPAKVMYQFTVSSTTELTVSQGGSAMDLDMLSSEKGPDGRLTPQARNTRRSLGRCYRCNQSGHLAINFHLGKFPRIPVSLFELSLPTESKQLKDQLQ